MTMGGLLSRPPARPPIPLKRLQLQSSHEASAAAVHATRMSLDDERSAEVSKTSAPPKTEVESNRINNAAGSHGDDEPEVKLLKAQIARLEDKVAILEGDKEGYKRKVERRDERIKELIAGRGHSCSNCEELPRIQKELSKAIEHGAKMKALSEHNYKMADKYFQQSKKLQEDNAKLEQTFSKLQNNAADRDMKAEQEHKVLQQKIREQEQLLKQAQEDVYNAKDSTGVLIESDSAVNSLLNFLERSINSFSKQHAIKGAGSDKLDGLFRANPALLNQMIDEAGMEALSDVRMAKVAPSMLLSAWLAHEVYRSIAENPWYFMEEMDAILFPKSEHLMEEGIMRLLGALQHGLGPDHKVLKSLRSDIFKAINPAAAAREDSPLRGTDDVVPKAILSAKHSMCSHFAKKFMTDAQLLIATPLNEDMYQQLYCIMTTGAEIAEKLHIQRCRIVLMGLPVLPEMFESQSRSMEPHGNHVVDLEDDETSLDGKKVLLVAHPEVVAIGSSDGTDNTTRRILKKAVVWMGKP